MPEYWRWKQCLEPECLKPVNLKFVPIILIIPLQVVTAVKCVQLLTDTWAEAHEHDNGQSRLL